MDVRAMKFRVGHGWRVGGLLSPPGRERAPAVLLLHGFPGFQKNEDIAAELARRGLVAFMPFFRGCWGSGDEFSVPGLLEDARAALRLLARYPHVDRRRVGVLGFSVGGWVALRLASQVPLAAVAALAPCPPRLGVPQDRDYLRRAARLLRSPGEAALWAQYEAAARRDRPGDDMPRIAPTPLLCVQGLRDRLVPPGSTLRLWSLAEPPRELLVLPAEGHEFQEDRAGFVAAVCDWLEARLESRAAPETAEPAELGAAD